jgi:hypothetical protein
VQALKESGGLGIKDPLLMNLAMGAKLLWRLISWKIECWKRILLRKYLEGPRLRCLDHVINNQGSPIWKLLQNLQSILQDLLTWILGNGKKLTYGHTV